MAEAARTRAEWVKQIGAEEAPPLRRALFESRPEWHDSETLTAIYAELTRWLDTDQARVRRLGEFARWSAEAAGDAPSLAASLRCEGLVYYAEARYEASIEAYRRALTLLDANGNDAGRVYSSGLQPLSDLGRYEEAHKWAERARKIFERHNDVALLARLAVSVGTVFFRQDRHEEARQQYEKALPALERSSEAQDYAAVLSNIANCCVHLGQFRAALEHYEAVRDWCGRHKLPALAASAAYNVAYLHYLRGDYLRARELYRVCRRHCEEAPDAYRGALCDLDESELLLELNLVADAEQLAERAAASFEHLGINYERAKAMLHQAAACFRRGDMGMAQKLFHQARRLLAREDNRYWRPILDLYQALVKEQQGVFKEARKLSERALQVFAHSPFAGKAALCHLLRARLWMSEGNDEAARQELRGLEKTPCSPALRFHWRYLNGTLDERGGETEQAEIEYAAAIRAAEEPYSMLWVDELKVPFCKDTAEVYAAAVRLTLQRGDNGKEDAFLWVQRAKAMRFRAEPANVPSGKNEAVQLLGDLAANYRRLEAAAAARRTPAHDTILALRERTQKSEQALLEAWGNTAQGNEEARPAIETVQRTLRPDAALIEYFAIGERLHAWVVTREKIEHTECGALTQIRDSFGFLQFQLGQFALRPGQTARFHGTSLKAARVHLRELYAALIAPLSASLSKARLIFAPVGFLQHVPFHALIDGNGSAIIDTHIVSYAPSARVYAQSALRETAETHGSLIVTAPDGARPGMEREALAIRELLASSELLMGREISLDELKRQCAGRRFLHLAAQGLLRRDNPRFSVIALGETRLPLFRLREMKLQAELVTVTGCGAPASVLTGTHEWIELMSGILAAGARGLLASLWEVNGESTTQFMTAFYRHLAAEEMEDPAAAARAAMLEVRETHSHVYYWAPFALVCGEKQWADEGLHGERQALVRKRAQGAEEVPAETKRIAPATDREERGWQQVLARQAFLQNGQQALPGRRAIRRPARLAVFRYGHYSIDLRAENELDSVRTVMLGQILQEDGSSGAEADVTLVSGAQTLLHCRCNKLGEFAMNFASHPRLRLRFDLPSERLSILVPLKDLG